MYVLYYAAHTCSLATHIALEDDGVDPKRFPRIVEHRARMAQREPVARAIAMELSA